MFTERAIVKDIMYDKSFFPSMIQSKLSHSTTIKLGMSHWKFQRAFSESDIIWEDLCKDKLLSSAKTFVLWVLLLVISVLLLSPVMLFEISTQLIADLNWRLPFISNTSLSTYMMTAMTAFLNVILIPFFIDVMVLIEDHPSKSRRQ